MDSGGEAQHLRPLRWSVAMEPGLAQVDHFAAFGHPGAAVVQTLLALYFLAQCARRAAPADCFWFPATVSLATPALTYPKLHQPEWVLYSTLAAGVLVAVLLWPPCLWRVLRAPREAAPPARSE